mgnify:CR=1 FL=1
MILPSGLRGLELFDLKGAKVFAYERKNGSIANDEQVEIPAHLRNSLLRASFNK